VGRAHAADAAVVAVVGRAGRVVGRQAVKRGRNPRRVEIVPERDALAPEIRFAVDGFGRPVEGGGRLLRVPGHEIKNAVRARCGAVDEAGPGDGTLRRNATAKGAETARRTELGEIREESLFHHAVAQAGVHAVDANHYDFFAGATGDAPAAAQPG